MSRNSSYWRKRSEEIAKNQHKKIDEYIDKLDTEYKEAILSIQEDIEVFYQRFADNNKISLYEAKMLLDSKALKEFKMTLKQFIKKAKDNNNLKWDKELNNVYFKTRVSRLQFLQVQLRAEIENLYSKSLENATELNKDIYEDTYYRNIYEVQKGLGIGTDFARINFEMIESAIKNPYREKNYSELIWGKYRPQLIQELNTTLVQSFIRGDSIDKTTRNITKRLDVDKKRIRTVVNTESAFLASQATFDSYKASNFVKKYKILATLDNRTSEICQDMDLKVFKLSEKETGVNAPPFHPNCRTTIVAVLEDSVLKDILGTGKRIARSPVTGKTYYVPSNMSYKEWYKSQVSEYGRETIESIQKKHKNKSSDKKQYSRYKDILGKDNVPKSFDDFQEMKYNDKEVWKFINLDYARRNKLLNDKTLRLPNGDNIIIADEKFTKYLFNKDNQKGYAKGLNFSNRLGYNENNWVDLKKEIINRALKYPVVKKLEDMYGARYEQSIIIYGLNNKPANVVVGWIVNENETKMTSTYIKEVKEWK